MRRDATTITDTEIKPHPQTRPDYETWLAIVTTQSGRRHFITYAGDKPTNQTVELAWREARREFQPYILL